MLCFLERIDMCTWYSYRYLSTEEKEEGEDNNQIRKKFESCRSLHCVFDSDQLPSLEIRYTLAAEAIVRNIAKQSSEILIKQVW